MRIFFFKFHHDNILQDSLQTQITQIIKLTRPLMKKRQHEGLLFDNFRKNISLGPKYLIMILNHLKKRYKERKY